MSIWDVLDPSCTYKKWKVDVSSYSGGHSKNFWFKKNALEYANTYKGSGYWVSLENNITEKSIKINDPQVKKKDPDCKHIWIKRSYASWWCSKCNAQLNLACEHGGSIACSVCIDSLIKKNEPFDDYLAEHSW